MAAQDVPNDSNIHSVAQLPVSSSRRLAAEVEGIRQPLKACRFSRRKPSFPWPNDGRLSDGNEGGQVGRPLGSNPGRPEVHDRVPEARSVLRLPLELPT